MHLSKADALTLYCLILLLKERKKYVCRNIFLGTNLCCDLKNAIHEIEMIPVLFLRS